VTLFFEDWRRCQEVRYVHIEEKRLRQLQREKSLIEEFLQRCEQEEINA
jgi:hypothetical protein